MTVEKKISNFITQVVDFFYVGPLKVIPLKTYRYATVGGMNVLFGIIEYWIIFNFIIFQKDVNLGIVVISAPIFAFLINFVITFFTGFWLMRNVAFSTSKLSGRNQIIRYSIVVAINILINYFGLKILISIGVYPSISNALIQPVTILVSYLLNSKFSFR